MWGTALRQPSLREAQLLLRRSKNAVIWCSFKMAASKAALRAPDGSGEPAAQESNKAIQLTLFSISRR